MATGHFHKDYRTKRCAVIVLSLTLLGSASLCRAQVQMNGFRVETADADGWPTTSKSGRVLVPGGHDVTVRLFTMHPVPTLSEVSFTTEWASRGRICDDQRSTQMFDLVPEVDFVGPGGSAIAVVRLPTDSALYMFCVRSNSSHWYHQGNRTWVQLEITDPVKATSLPLWAMILIVTACLILSSICVGLAVTVLSLSRPELKLLRSAGTSEERHFVKAVGPLRKRGNRVMCALVFAGIFANAVVAVLIEDMISLPGAAMAISAGLITLIAVIIPLIVCSQIGLVFIAKTAWLTNVFVVITFIFSYPLGRLLDWLMSDDLPLVIDRDRLHCLTRMNQPTTAAKEVEDENAHRAGVPGSLGLSTKSAKDLMTKLESVFMVEYNTVLDESSLEMIAASGYTRIPVFEKERTNIVALLHVQDLAYVTAADRTSLQTLCKFYNHPVNFVFEDTKLEVMLEEFKKGQSHMAFVQRVNSEGPGDPFYETLGMITLDDVIEDIFQSEVIIDPPDIIMDNKEVKKMNRKNFAHLARNKRDLSPQIAMAVCQFLSSSVSPFCTRVMSENIVSRLLKQDVIVSLRLSDTNCKRTLYERGSAADYFAMIVEGHVQVHVGSEDFVFDGGPFMYFGTHALTGDVDLSEVMKSNASPMGDVTLIKEYVPDYTVVAITDLVYVKISVSQYRAALRAAALEAHLNAEASDCGVDIFAALNGGFVSPAEVECTCDIPSFEATSRSQLLNSGNGTSTDSCGLRSGSTGSRTSVCDV